MRVIRYEAMEGRSKPKYGWVLDNRIGEISGNIFGRYGRKEVDTPLGDVRLLAPTEPSKIVCVGRNYVEHARELGNEVPKIPLIFLKPPSAIINPGETVILPPQSQQVEHEAELIVVIGKRCHNVTAEDAKKYIFGYTVGNDVTARDIQNAESQWTRAKGFDTFCPFGPWIDTEFNAADAVITCKVNGEPRQMASTRDMLFNVRQLIAYISSIMTVEPGDVLMTGTPAGVGLLQAGDAVQVVGGNPGQPEPMAADAAPGPLSGAAATGRFAVGRRILAPSRSRSVPSVTTTDCPSASTCTPDSGIPSPSRSRSCRARSSPTCNTPTCRRPPERASRARTSSATRSSSPRGSSPRAGCSPRARTARHRGQRPARRCGTRRGSPRRR